MKDVAQDMAEDVAEDVWGAEKDGSLAVLFVARVIFQRRETPKHTRAAPHAALGLAWATREGRAREGRVPPPTLHVKDVAQGAEMGAQLGSSVAFGSYSGKALPGGAAQSASMFIN